jgi:hypothetical protein
MASIPYLPHGTTVTVDSVDIGGLVNITTPESSVGVVVTTTNDSSRIRSYIAGLVNNGSLSLVCRDLSDDAGQTALRANVGATAALAMVVTLPATSTSDSTVTTVSFDAFVTASGAKTLPQDQDEAAGVSFTLKVAQTITEATA